MDFSQRFSCPHLQTYSCFFSCQLQVVISSLCQGVGWIELHFFSQRRQLHFSCLVAATSNAPTTRPEKRCTFAFIILAINIIHNSSFCRAYCGLQNLRMSISTNKKAVVAKNLSSLLNKRPIHIDTC